jgi:internalin A
MRGEAAQIPVKAFLCYAPEDVPYREQMTMALAPLVRLGKLHIWADHDIMAGAERQKEIARELGSADIVLCLLSADFINSDFCYSEVLGQALAAHRRGEQRVVPIRLRPCMWEGLPLHKLQHTPTSEWITTHANQDMAWLEVANHLAPLLEQVKAEKARKGRAGRG